MRSATMLPDTLSTYYIVLHIIIYIFSLRKTAVWAKQAGSHD
jgi:hypothetical protein